MSTETPFYCKSLSHLHSKIQSKWRTKSKVLFLSQLKNRILSLEYCFRTWLSKPWGTLRLKSKFYTRGLRDSYLWKCLFDFFSFTLGLNQHFTQNRDCGLTQSSFTQKLQILPIWPLTHLIWGIEKTCFSLWRRKGMHGWRIGHAAEDRTGVFVKTAAAEASRPEYKRHH